MDEMLQERDSVSPMKQFKVKQVKKFRKTNEKEEDLQQEINKYGSKQKQNEEDRNKISVLSQIEDE